MNPSYSNPQFQFRELPEKPIVKLKPNPWCIFLKSPLHLIKISLSLLVILPIFKVALDWYRLHETSYFFTNQRIRIESGIFDVDIDDVLLFRVTDMRIKRPWLYRFLKLADFYIYSTDPLQKLVVVKGINYTEAHKLFGFS
jgi:membrane protein YdbS with pleckstrin-like domain